MEEWEVVVLVREEAGVSGGVDAAEEGGLEECGRSLREGWEGVGGG